MRPFVKAIPKAAQEFAKERDFIYGAALAFYTTFSLVPVLYILIEALGLFFGENEIREAVMSQFSEHLGSDVASNVAGFVSKSGANGPNLLSRIVGVVILIFSSSAIFYAVQDSLNKMWKLPYVQKAGIRRSLLDRLTSLAMLLGLGLLFVISIVFETALMSLIDVVVDWFPKIDKAAILTAEHSIALVLNAIIFTIIFKVLPYATVPWRVALTGGVFTAVIFHIGQMVAIWYLSSASITSTYGAASAIMVILAFVFISAQIFFLGAKYTHVYARESGRSIIPSYE